MTTLLILTFLIAASLPFITQRLFLFWPRSAGKSVGLRLLELLVFYGFCMLIARGLESRFSGDIYPQTWEFYVTTFCFFLVLAVPSVIYRYQWLPAQAKTRGS